MPEQSAQGMATDKKYCPRCYGQFESSLNVCPDDGAELRNPSNDPLIGKVFADRYEIQSVLGTGGMSIVYKAQHRLMNRTVAIKMLHKVYKEEVVALERFRLEAEAASQLNHQNIVSVYDFGVTPEGEPFFVMDCLQGESLQELISRKGKVPYERALPIFRQICDALDAAHKKGIVHRDLKAANVVLVKQPDGSELVKLVDFGIAKILPQDGKQQQHLTRTGEIFGSPICMSPEQCLGQPLDVRTDIYALGCLMYETLTGGPPFMGDSLLVTMNKHVSEPPKPISQVVPEAKVPPELEELVLKCMAKSPGDRCQSAGEVFEILTAIAMAKLGTTGSNAARTSGVRVPIKPCSSKFAPSKIVAAVAVTIVVLWISFLAIWPGPPYDRGTPLSKIIWQVCMAFGESAADQKNYAVAEKLLADAENRARSFGDNKVRLEASLKIEADLYNNWDGHAEDLERINNEITALQVQRITGELHKQLAELDVYAQPTTSAVRESSLKLKAEAQVPSLLATIERLYGRGMYREEKLLLTKAIAVDRKLLGDDSVAIALLSTKLADCLGALREYSAVRPLLSDACRIRKMHSSDNPVEYALALSKLGQFDSDRSDYKDAGYELAEALLIARRLKGSKETLLLCMRSYADLLKQTGKDAEARQLLSEADALQAR